MRRLVVALAVAAAAPCALSSAADRPLKLDEESILRLLVGDDIGEAADAFFQYESERQLVVQDAMGEALSPGQVQTVFSYDYGDLPVPDISHQAQKAIEQGAANSANDELIPDTAPPILAATAATATTSSGAGGRVGLGGAALAAVLVAAGAAVAAAVRLRRQRTSGPGYESV